MRSAKKQNPLCPLQRRSSFQALQDKYLRTRERFLPLKENVQLSNRYAAIAYENTLPLAKGGVGGGSDRRGYFKGL
jgi:hypothetical protein